MGTFFAILLLCANFLLIKGEDNGILRIDLFKDTTHCLIHRTNLKLTEGQNLTLEFGTDMVISYGWWRIRTPYNLITVKDSDLKHNHTTVVESYMEGKWEFEFYVLMNNGDYMKNVPKVYYPKSSQNFYMPLHCSANVTVEWDQAGAGYGRGSKLIIICAVLGTIALIIIIAQAVYIYYLKALARRLNAHRNLSKKAESAESDRARYCSNPRQKKVKEVEPVDNRDSVIYEAPNIEINDSGRKHLFPPSPPAIATMPCTPKMDRNVGMHQQMHGASLNRTPRNQMMDQPNFSRQTERDMANRPPLPLPPAQDNHEVYEQMTDDMDTYEPPPATNHTMPPRLPMPPKKVPTANLVNVKEDSLKPKKPLRPPVTPKPQMPQPTAAPVNELEQVLKRRQAELETATRSNAFEQGYRQQNNVKQVPIVSIPDPSAPKQRPIVKYKPKIPQPQPVREEIYYNENQASSDEEWTYEPLKPHNNYDPNIYNI